MREGRAGTGRRLGSAIVAAVLAGATLLPVALWRERVVLAQNFGQRTILGKVRDDRDAKVTGATVFLKNTKTKDVKSFTTVSDGGFRFAQVGMLDDYEVWAEHAGHKSAVKTVSSFDSRKEVEFDLKLK